MQRDVQDILKAGNEILNSVSSAIDRNDYSSLRADVAKAVKSVSYDRNVTYASKINQEPTKSTTARQKVFPFLQKKISRYLGIPEITISGSLGAFVLLGFLGSIIAAESIPAVIVFGILTAISGFFFFKGLSKYKLAKKYYQYGNILRDAEYFNISDLARVALKPDKEVLNDIKNMIRQGFLPRARLDRSETTCMITDRAYQQYMGAEYDREEREKREKARKDQEIREAKQRNAEYKDLPTNVVQILEEGREYISFVRQINDEIPDTEELSTKLYRLEEIMNRIFAQVKKDPSTADELHKLMDYYLPTTKKLLNAYVELDKQPEVGTNITETKQEIEGAIDTINTAFESLLDSLFQDMAWDISSDISVMKTMMAQDGLTVEGQGVSAMMQQQTASAQAMGQYDTTPK